MSLRDAAEALCNGATDDCTERRKVFVDPDDFDRLNRALDLAATPSDRAREAVRLEVINTPETADFMSGVPIEAAHQRERFPHAHDANKSPFDWFWLIGYLSQKAAAAAVNGDLEKAKHHTISTAAALANWHRELAKVEGSSSHV